jgi:hypothetical protein
MVATVKAGYYPMSHDFWNQLYTFHVVFRLDDENCTPYLIEYIA